MTSQIPTHDAIALISPLVHEIRLLKGENHGIRLMYERLKRDMGRRDSGGFEPVPNGISVEQNFAGGQTRRSSHDSLSLVDVPSDVQETIPVNGGEENLEASADGQDDERHPRH